MARILEKRDLISKESCIAALRARMVANDGVLLESIMFHLNHDPDGERLRALIERGIENRFTAYRVYQDGSLYYSREKPGKNDFPNLRAAIDAAIESWTPKPHTMRDVEVGQKAITQATDTMYQLLHRKREMRTWLNIDKDSTFVTHSGDSLLDEEAILIEVVTMI